MYKCYLRTAQWHILVKWFGYLMHLSPTLFCAAPILTVQSLASKLDFEEPKVPKPGPPQM